MMMKIKTPQMSNPRKHHRVLPVLMTVAAVILVILQSHLAHTPRPTPLTLGQLKGLAHCHLNSLRPAIYTPVYHRINPRAPQHRPFVLRNATVIDGDGTVLGLRDIFIEKGTIAKIKEPGLLPVGIDGYDIDLGGKFLTPGIIGESSLPPHAKRADMHSHLGDWSLPEYEASLDANELSEPVTPQMRALDGFNPSDESLSRVVSPLRDQIALITSVLEESPPLSSLPDRETLSQAKGWRSS